MNIFSLSYSFLIVALAFLSTFSEAIASGSVKQVFCEAPCSETDLSKSTFTTLMQVDLQATQADINRQYAELNEFLAHLQRKQRKYRSEKRFLSYFFYQVHRKFLKQYRPHTTLYELLERGSYDCVTGSALYALLLEALGVSYQVNEFPYHVYLTVATAEADTFLIESTDPQGGWVTNQTEQKRRFDFYSQVDEEDQAYFQYDFTIRGTIDLTQLAGLSYFNEAVAHYNQRSIQQAVLLLHRAERLYASPRMEAFKTLVSSVAQNN